MCGPSEFSGNHLSCILTHFFDALEELEVPPEAKIILNSGPFSRSPNENEWPGTA